MAKKSATDLMRGHAMVRAGNGGSKNGTRHGAQHTKSGKRTTADPVELAIFKNALHSIAEEMGAASDAPLFLQISRSAAIIRAPYSMARATSSPWATHARSLGLDADVSQAALQFASI